MTCPPEQLSRIRARWLLDERFKIIDNACLNVTEGRIAHITSGGPADIDLGDCVLLPGLVNAHTHLELGYAAGQVPPSTDFFDWLHRLLDFIRGQPDEVAAVSAAFTRDLRTCVEEGVTLVGDITRHPAVTRAIHQSAGVRPSLISYGEVIGIGRLAETAEARIAAARAEPEGVEHLTCGISPHAPYTVTTDVLRQCLRDPRRPVCIHAAETPAEVEFLRNGTGRVQEYLADLGLLDGACPALGCTPIAWLEAQGALSSQTLLAHANYLADDDITHLARTGAHVAFCPRTHAAFGHRPHPFMTLLQRGINVCLGTDSLASNPSLSLLDEMRQLQRMQPDVTPATIWQMASLNGARALGCGTVTGVLAPGRQADVIALPSACTNPQEVLHSALDRSGGPIFVMLRGEVVAATSTGRDTPSAAGC